MTSLTKRLEKVLAFLTELHLESYYDKFISVGFDDTEYFADIQLEDLLEMGMLKGHARRVIGQINRDLVSNSSTSAATGETKSNSDQMRQAPSVDREEEDIDNLPIAHEVVALGIVDNVGRSNAASSSSSSTFDFNSMKKEMRDQMEVEFNARLEERLAEERLARERMEQEHIARMTDERAAIRKEMELESSKAVAVAVERMKREVATSTGETKEHVGVEKTLISGSGKRYVGKISEGDENKGKGRFTCEEHGLIYDGEFQLDSFHGNGIFTWSSGAYAGDKFVGEYKGSFRNGCGVYTWSSGWKYVGEFKNDKLHGQGTQFKPNGTIFHTGEWVNDKPNK